MRKVNRAYWKIRIFFLALRWIPQINLGDVVKYNGRKYIVHNGARYNSWRLAGLRNADDGWVSRSDCTKVFTLKNIRNSFMSGWNFYMRSSFDIWCREGIKDWMRGCNIWPWPVKKYKKTK